MKLTLDIDIEQIVIGISCHFKNYRLAWMINQKLDFRLKRMEDHIITTFLDREELINFAFPMYEYYDHVNHIKYRLLNNHTSFTYAEIHLQDTLIPEYNKFDYILLIDGYLSETEKQHLIKKLKEIKIILAVMELDVNKIKKKENLIF